MLHDSILLLGISGNPFSLSSNKYFSFSIWDDLEKLFIVFVFSSFDEDLILSSSSEFSTSSISISSEVSFFNFDFSLFRLSLALDEIFISSSSSIKFQK